MSNSTDTRIFRTLIVHPKPGNDKEVLSLLSTHTAADEENFPGILQALIFTIPPTIEDDRPKIMVHAIYEDQTASDQSHSTPEFAKFMSTLIEKGLLSKPVERYQGRLVAGYQREITKVVA